MGNVAAVHHVRRHVQPAQREMDEGGQLVPVLANMREAFQVKDEDVRECPQAHLHHALLELFAVGTLPSIIWGKLKRKKKKKIGL